MSEMGPGQESFNKMAVEGLGTEGTPATSPYPRPLLEGGQAPRHLGEYRILREVARGGMGVVYEAVQEPLGRHVALKVLPPHTLTRPGLLERFRREAQAAARLHHTNIVPVFGVGEHEGTHFYAMQFIQGQSLDHVLRELRQWRGRPAPERGVRGGECEPTHKPAPPTPGARSGRPAATESASASATLGQPEGEYFRSVARVGIQVAEALAYAHQMGVLHRDVKPANLLLDARGTVWVTDFGLAKSEGAEGLTSPGDIVGTIRYMAPERFRGEGDARGDLYSLGVTLYEMATLRPAFSAPDRGRLIERILHEEPPPPREVDALVPRDLETIILKAIAKDPGQRYASAAALAEDLRRFLADRPIRARRVTAWERGWRWCRRNPVVAGLAGSLAVLLLALGAGLVVNGLLRGERDRALRAEAEARDLLGRAQNAEREVQIRSHLAQAMALRRGHQAGQRFGALAEVAEALKLGPSAELRQELRNEAIACLALPDMRVAREWPGWPAGSAQLAFDGRLERYARTDREGQVSVRRTADDAEVYHFPSGLGAASPALSPDGRYLALCDSRRYELWKLEGPKAVRLLRELDCSAHDFSPDGRLAAVVSLDGTVRLYDLSSGQRAQEMRPGPHTVRFLAFHPGGRRLALSHAGGVQVRDVETGAALADLPQAGAEHLAWHPGGKALAVVGSDQAIHLWDVTAREEVVKFRRWKNAGLRITFNRAGDVLASCGWEHMVRLWDPRTGEELFHMPAELTGAPLHFGADDLLLAADVKGDKVRLWEIVKGDECRRLVRNPARGKAPYGPFTVSPDGRTLAACTPDGFGLWCPHTGRPLAHARSEPLDGVLFEPSGALLTAGPAGISRWAFGPGRGQARRGALPLGPPQRLPLPGTSGTQIACSRDGRVLASAQRWGALVLHADRPDRPVRLEPHEDARAVAVSPDGRWVVTGSQHSTGVRVWEARTGKPVKDLLPHEGWVRVSFSPDGRWLATRGNSLRLWAVGSWEEGPSLGGIPGAAFAFSPAGGLLATETGYGAVRLVDPETGREYARLEDPDQVRVAWMSFSPDGTRLLTAGAGSGAWVRAWDLRAIRRQLAEMGLDRGLPLYALRR
jgi:serine/threonine protein kinase/WD40 repeat protein